MIRRLNIFLQKCGEREAIYESAARENEMSKIITKPTPTRLCKFISVCLYFRYNLLTYFINNWYVWPINQQHFISNKYQIKQSSHLLLNNIHIG
jgi:hypothetical protein